MPRGRKQYDDEFKRHIVELYDAGQKQAELAKTYKLHPTSIRNWVDFYHNSGSFKQKTTLQGVENARKYVLGLMSGAERKNSWQLAENLGEKTPYALQQFLYRGRWEADELRDELRGYVAETLGELEGVLIMTRRDF